MGRRQRARRAGRAMGLGFELTMAFQPIVDAESRSIYAYEALVRGEGGLSAPQVLSMVNEENRYAFDQTCRVKAIELAAKLGVAKRGAKLSVNFMPGAVYSPAACIRRTLQAAKFHQFPLSALMFEITETERVSDVAHLQRIATEYAKHGFTLALDDFGAGFSGMNLLAELNGNRVGEAGWRVDPEHSQQSAGTADCAVDGRPVRAAERSGFGRVRGNSGGVRRAAGLRHSVDAGLSVCAARA